ncbi:MAG TPA: hypothetical protein VFB80_18155 [Pirellulaceae bacterium]|nr:hypothetical protein [Pirellulaceae bacterium]
MRYKLRTLLILLAIMPPLLWIGWTKYAAWKAEQGNQRVVLLIDVVETISVNDLGAPDARIIVQPLPADAPPAIVPEEPESR